MIVNKKNGAKGLLLRGAPTRILPVAALLGATLLLNGCAGLVIAGAAGSMGAAGGIAASQPADLEADASKETSDASDRTSSTASGAAASGGTAAAGASDETYQPGSSGALRHDEISTQSLAPQPLTPQ